MVRGSDGRPRAGCRIALFLAVFIAMNASLALSTRAAMGSLRRDSFLVIAILAFSATAAVAIARRFFDRRSFVSLGLGGRSRAIRDLVFGFGLSGVMAAAVFVILWQTGHAVAISATTDPARLAAIVLTGLASTALIGFWEELVFRGYLFHNLRDGIGLTATVIISCLLYGAVHAANPNATLVSSAIIVGFGLLRLYGVLATGLLWLSMGMHIGWNFFQAPVLGFAASGHTESATIIEHTRAGPDWISGGAFGLEGSVVTLPVMGLALVAMWGWSRRRSSSRTPRAPTS
ncbi:MAG: CPBP family intramembrane glutamic endopeptidase [Planctomycetota bacterium]